MKRIIPVVLIFIFLLTGCGAKEKNDKLQIVTTIFPIYDWTNNIVGEGSDAEVSLLLQSGSDMHSYEPTADDILLIANADVFIYVGGESDAWVDDVLSNTANESRVSINLLEALGDRGKAEEIVEGMESEEEEEEEEVLDEHIWLSARNAKCCVNAILDALSKVNPSESSAYSDNATAYNKLLDDIDKSFEEVTEKVYEGTLLFGDRFPFRYFTEDYGLTYYAPFPGCSAESEASFETLLFLTNKVNELELHEIFVLENSDEKIARTIIDNCEVDNMDVYSLDSMQSITSEDIEAGVSYLEIMNSNLETFKKAFGE